MDNNTVFYTSAAVISSSRIVSLDQVEDVKAFVDFAVRGHDGSLVVIGWIYDPCEHVRGFSLLFETHKKSSMRECKVFAVEEGRNFHAVRFSRPDVAHVMAVTDALDERFGFAMVFPEFPSTASLTLALGDGRFALLPFVVVEEPDTILGALAKYWQHSGLPLLSVLDQSLGRLHPLTQAALTVQSQVVPESKAHSSSHADSLGGTAGNGNYHIECVIKQQSGLVLIGWLATMDADIVIELSDRNGWQKRTTFRDGENNQILTRTFRPDLKSFIPALQFDHGKSGFVFFWPLADDIPSAVSVRFAGCMTTQREIAIIDAVRSFEALSAVWVHAGDALKKMATRLPDAGELSALLADVEEARDGEFQPGFAACDQALLLNNRILILNGWIARPSQEIEWMELSGDNGRFDITPRIRHYVRPDLYAAYPWSRTEALGFLCIIEDPQMLSCNVRLKIVCRDGRCQILRPQAGVMDWAMLGQFINHHPMLSETLLEALAATPSLETDPSRLSSRISLLRKNAFITRHQHLSTSVEQPETVMASIDRAFPLGEAGLLIFGWQLTPKLKPVSMTVRSPEGAAVEVDSRLSLLPRTDVEQHFQQRFPGISEWCGFACLIPLSTKPGEPRVLSFDFGREGGEVWLKIPTDKSALDGVELIKEILGMIPAPEKMRHALYELFSSGIGPALEAINRTRPPFGGRIEERQFGRGCAADVSVIVPLYGRCDFLRHQLAQFADDPDFGSVDLIYVVDDPAILAETLELAAQYHPLFDIPFRVIWYGENRGFAGANNIGARAARGRNLLLMNSDVIPRSPGWLSALRTALDTLPTAGAVGPLLQFADGSIQHAGMHPSTSPLLPGFLINTHPRMGQAWSGPDEPAEQPMLTAACLMLRTADYLAAGGLDEGYVVGDFEDSDLCLALRKRGMRLWLEPRAKLWHLERQSQALEHISQRQLLTLFNAWRYHEKIDSGVITDPTRQE